MTTSIAHSIGVLVKGANSLANPMAAAARTLQGFKKTAEATALGINKAFADPIGVNMDAIRDANQHLKDIGVRAMAAGGVMAAGLGLAVKSAADFDAVMAEVSTIVDTSTTDMGALTAQVQNLSLVYGQMPETIGKSTYEIISAGFADASDAIRVMEGSLKLARGGAAELVPTVLGLTSTLNAYGMTGREVTRVSDMMFVAAQDGATKIEELSVTLGRVTPIAAAAGVGLDQVLAATSTLTLSGLSTAESVTALRGVLTQVIKPTHTARKLAQELGLDFSVTALRAKGLAGFLADVALATKGDTTAIGKLFHNVEGLTGVLALGGSQAGRFSQIVQHMGTSAGATEVAFGKMNDRAGAGFGRLKASLAVMTDHIGGVLLPMVGAAATGIADLVASFSRFAEAHPLLLQTTVLLTAVTAGTLLFGGAALIMAGQVALAMMLINVSTGGLLLIVGGVSVGITALVTAGWALADGLAEQGGIINRAWGGIRDGFMAFARPVAAGMGWLAGSLISAWQTVSAWAVRVWEPLSKVIGVALIPLVPLFFVAIQTVGLLHGAFIALYGVAKTVLIGGLTALGAVLTGIGGFVLGTVQVIWSSISGLVEAVLKLVTGDLGGAWAALKGTASGVLGGLTTMFSSFIGVFVDLGGILYDSGVGMIMALWDGMKAGWGTMKSGFIGLLEGFRSLLPFSDAKEGPLSALTASGAALMSTLATGMRLNADQPALTLQAALAPIPTMTAAVQPQWQPVSSRGKAANDDAWLQDAVGSRRAGATNAGSSVTFGAGAIQVTVNATTGSDGIDLDDLEQKLAGIFRRLALQNGAPA